MLKNDRTQEERGALAARAVETLGSYVDKGGFAVASPNELFDDSLRDLSLAVSLRVSNPRFEGNVNFVDRRMVGADWLRSPEPPAGAPARFVFSSLKGGVGRSTALCVLAAHLASSGRRVLAIDMDLEAPGLGNLLLPDETLPEFGLLDYLVELEAGSELGEEFFLDVVGPSWLGGGRGRVDVIPAIGRRSLLYPANVLAKLARAYLAGSGPDGETATFSDHMRMLVERYAIPTRYDSILVDARAGLHETTAAAIVGLGGEVLLFGMDQPQTFAGYELLFAHLATLRADTDNDWQNRLHIVQAKAPVDPQSRSRFFDRMSLLRDKYLAVASHRLQVKMDPSALRETFEVDWDETDSDAVEELLDVESPTALSIIEDDRFRAFDPLVDRKILSSSAYSASYGELIDMAEGVLIALADARST
jgi:MinD-like ATPase involved in chromosome partitioning or flagellar assembly